MSPSKQATIRRRALYEESLLIHRELGHAGFISFVLPHIGRVAYRQHDYARAATAFAESLALAQAAGEIQGIVPALLGLAEIAVAQGMFAQAVRLCGAIHSAMLRTSAPRGESEDPVYAPILAEGQLHLDATAFAGAWREGQTVPLSALLTRAALVPPPPDT